VFPQSWHQFDLLIAMFVQTLFQLFVGKEGETVDDGSLRSSVFIAAASADTRPIEEAEEAFPPAALLGVEG
jgi:hypothetical protein